MDFISLRKVNLLLVEVGVGGLLPDSKCLRNKQAHRGDVSVTAASRQGFS